MNKFIVGLDLGQARDFTAIAVLQIARRQPDGQKEYHLRHLERPKLGTTYPEIVRRTRELLDRIRLDVAKVTLVLDLTGCGRPVYDLFDAARLHPMGINITGGNAIKQDGPIFSVPKRDLVSNLQVLLQSGRLKVAAAIPETKELINELLNFKSKISVSGHDSYEAWREGDHDDLVLAVALAAWYAEVYLSAPLGLKPEVPVIRKHKDKLSKKKWPGGH